VTPRAWLLLAALALATVLLATTRPPQPPDTAAAATAPSAARRAPAAGPQTPVDPGTIRDVFRFVERKPSPPARPVPRGTEATAAPAPASDIPRLVGLVRRQNRLLAAFSVAGEVVLAGPGDTAASVTVVDVSDEGVRVRRKDGSVELLRVP
jgi:hypothetical protein